MVGTRGPLGNFPRGVYAESAFFVHAVPAVVTPRLLHWDPTKHKQSDVQLFREYGWPASAGAWAPLALNSQRGADRWLIDRTSQLVTENAAPADLHLTEQDVGSFRAAAGDLSKISATERDRRVSEFWRQILRTRDGAVASGGLPAVPFYSAGDVRIGVASEIESLVKMAPAIATRFNSLLKTAPFTRGGNIGGAETVPYWEASQVRGHTALRAGFLVSRKTASGWQLADCTYFTSDTYFCAIALYELWPVGNGTLVWQIDFASAPFRSFTGGVDRVFAGREMLKETAQTAKLFRADLEQP